MPPVAVAEFQDAIGELAARSGEAADALLSRIRVLSPAEARAFITDAYPALLEPYLKASSDLTMQWYAEQPTAPTQRGSGIFVPEAAPMRAGEQLAISGRWALSTSDPSTALRGNATRQVLNQSRDTVIVNAQREGVRWVRQAKSNACGFCKMLATRAAKDLAQYSYKSEGVRKKLDRYGNPTGDYTLMVIGKRGRKRRKNGRNLGSEYHDHCRCTAVPIRDGNYEPPEYVQQWTEQYDAIVKEHGTGDLLKISNLMDAGRIRPDRIKPAVDAGADLFTAAAATEPAPPVNLDEPPTRTKGDELRDAVAKAQADIEEPDNRTSATAKQKQQRRDARRLALQKAQQDLAAAEADGSVNDVLSAPVTRATKAKPRDFATVENEFNAAVEAGDDAAIDRLADELEAIEAAERKAAERAAKAKARREAVDREKWDRVGQLIDEGYNPIEAESDVFGISMERLRRRDFIAKARADGHQGKGFDELLASVFKAMSDEQYLAAENATNGHMIKRQFAGKVGERDLWRITEAQARKVMSDEMAAWFDQNGRLTKSALRESILSGSDVWRNPMTADFLQ